MSVGSTHVALTPILAPRGTGGSRFCPTKIGYLVNMYPKVSHTFIRREIAALESMGMSVQRFSQRRTEEELVDPADQREKHKTRVILDQGSIGLLMAMLRVALTDSRRFLRALGLTLRLGWGSDRGLFVNLIYLAEACVMLGWCRQGKVKHLHAHFGTNPAIVAMLCRELGGPPYSFTVHGPGEFDRPKALRLGQKIARAKFVVAVSDFGRSQLFRWCSHEHWSKIHVIRCGLDGAFFNSVPPPLPREPRLVCVGRLCEQKGQLLLLGGAKRLVDEAIGFELVLVGDGEMRPQIERRIAELDLADRVRMTGWVTNDQVRREILASRALCVPSFAEGLPVVIMESFALGRPVISTYVAGIPELIRNGENGWLVPSGSTDALTQAMREALLASPKQLERMGLAGAERARRMHNIHTEAARLGRLFLESSDRGLPLHRPARRRNVFGAKKRGRQQVLPLTRRHSDDNR